MSTYRICIDLEAESDLVATRRFRELLFLPFDRLMGRVHIEEILGQLYGDEIPLDEMRDRLPEPPRGTRTAWKRWRQARRAGRRMRVAAGAPRGPAHAGGGMRGIVIGIPIALAMWVVIAGAIWLVTQ